MPYLKSIPIRTNPKQSIAYIFNLEKTDGRILTKGINCIADPEVASSQFQLVYEHFESPYGVKSVGQKSKIKAHHFVYAFEPGTVDPEQALELTEEWTRRTFGDERQIVMATHMDREHIHSHIIINSVDFHGKKYHSNKSTLKRARDISDELVKMHGMSVIEGNQKKNVSYKEWNERKQGRSWKHQIRLAIDQAIIRSDSLEQVLEKIEAIGFVIKRGKYISVRGKDQERFVRTKTLGPDYTEERLIERIREKHKEMPILETVKVAQKRNPQSYAGMQLKYVSMIRLVANLIIGGEKPPRKYQSKLPYSKENDADIQMLAMQLQFLNREGITSEWQLIEKMNAHQMVLNASKLEWNRATSVIESIDGVIRQMNEYSELSLKSHISQAEKLRMAVLEQVKVKYGIRDSFDLELLRTEQERLRLRKEQLDQEWKRHMQTKRMMQSVLRTHEEITQERYVKQIQNKDQSR
jgi:nitrogen regulatory protein PII